MRIASPSALGTLSENNTVTLDNTCVSLSGDDARVWALCDGQRSLEELRLALALDAEAIFAALDRLADLGLVNRRVTPPAGSSSMSRATAIAAAAVLVTSGAVSRLAPHDEIAGRGQEQGHKKAPLRPEIADRGQEQHHKNAPLRPEIADRGQEQHHKNAPLRPEIADRGQEQHHKNAPLRPEIADRGQEQHHKNAPLRPEIADRGQEQHHKNRA